MDKSLPDKWIRKAVYDAFNGTLVDGEAIRVFDTRQPSESSSFDTAYVLMTVQTNSVNFTKCEDYYTSEISLEIVTFYPATGDTGSRLKADNILDELRLVLNPKIELDVASGLKTITQVMQFPSDIVTPGLNKNIFRKFLRLSLKIQ